MAHVHSVPIRLVSVFVSPSPPSERRTYASPFVPEPWCLWCLSFSRACGPRNLMKAVQVQKIRSAKSFIFRSTAIAVMSLSTLFRPKIGPKRMPRRLTNGGPRCSPQPKAGMARRAYADASGPLQPSVNRTGRARQFNYFATHMTTLGTVQNQRVVTGA